MNTDPATTASTLAEVIDAALRDHRSADRAEKEKAYLKSNLDHYGVSVPDTRAVVRTTLREVTLSHDEIIELAQELWAVPIHERRTAATMVLIHSEDRLGVGDAGILEGFLRESKTWALVDPLAGVLVGGLSEKDAGFDPVLERWAVDDDFWIRRSALLAHLRPLREGRGDFDRFARFADAMLEEKEFFIRKAIGWVLRDTARKRPELVFDWMLPRADRASGVTMREVVKYLSPEQKAALTSRRRS